MRDPRQIELRREAAAALGNVPIRNMVPASADFLAAVGRQRRGVAIVACVESEHDRTRVTDAEVAALAASDTALRAGLGEAKLPVLASELCVSLPQIFSARLAGADAVLVPAALPGAEVQALLAAASSAHMIGVLEIADAAELGALELRPRAALLATAE